MIRYTWVGLTLLMLSSSVVTGQARSGAGLLERGRSPEGALKELKARAAQIEKAHEDLIAKLTELQKLVKAGRNEEAAQKCAALISAQEASYEAQSLNLKRKLARFERVTAPRQQSGPRVGVGQPARLFQAETLDGKTVDLTQDKGKIIVLEWINFDCPYSRYHYRAKKTMIKLAQKYKSKGVIWVAVNSTHTTSEERYQHFLTNIGLKELPYPIVDDRSGLLGRAFGARTTPQVIIVNKEGRVAYNGTVDNAPLGKLQGPNQGIVNYVDRALSELVAGRPVSTLETELFGCNVKYKEPQ